ncbi:nck-associated protein 5-like isoform X2 [Sphaeramia orbicularis]|uniref:nck-associated protein 5-like isoform X2 n=1 Tax=Sphaeramia orbicularis TaxID=375764 RepID=UPI00117C6158|nr:nck-associated protein 5-like isoform X2 [Sphaeramia orbicularis]
MSQFVDNGIGRIRNVPLLELLAEYMDANKCIDELLKQLEEERRSVRREKLAVARLQREVARSKSEGTMREKLIHELEEERRLRLESEKRLREVTEESELGRAQMVSLQQQFSRMEETVRSLLQNQGVLEQTAVDTVDLMKAYKDKLSEEVQKQHDGPEENGSLPATQMEPDPGPLPLNADPDAGQEDEDKDKTKLLLDRLKTLEEENSVLASENESQREQYERCLDEVANQVVQALLTQKDLREECLKLRTRVFDLEQQNRALSVLFQQRIKPASDLLLQKLHSRIMDLSAADLLLEPERSKAFLLSRNTDSPSNEVQLNGKAGFPVTKCLSQLSLTVPAPVYPRSSCSSSELSLSSACSEFSSGSYTWNDGRSCGKMSSLTWEKRLSLGSSAPSNICAPLEEQLPTRRKESHILEGLRKLQRKKHRSASTSKVSKSGYKDCMNSNEGIYSLGIKSSSKGVSKPNNVGRTAAAGSKKFSYDSDDADDELAQSSRGDNIPTKDSWFYCKKLSHSISDSLCSWEGLQDSGGGDNNSSATKHPPGYDSKERPEKLMSFINSFLPEGSRTSAFSKPCKLLMNPSDSEGPSRLSDMDDTEELNSESSDIRMSFFQPAEQVEREPKRLSRDAAKLLPHQHLRKDQARTQSADGRPRPFSLIKAPKGDKCTQSEESILAIFDAEGEPIELCAQKLTAGVRPQNEFQGGKAVANYAELVPQERPTRQKSANARNYTVLESPEKPSEYQSRIRKSSNGREGSEERRSMQLTPQRKLIKPPSSRADKGHSIPPMNDPVGTKTGGSKIPGHKSSGSPLRLSKGSTTEPSNSGKSGLSAQEKSPLSPTVKMSRYIKNPGNCSQSPKAVNSKLPSRAEWSKTSSGSPHLARRHLEYNDNGEQPTRDKHCETSKNKLRSPSPPPPPGRTTSLLIRPNYEGSPQAHKAGAAQQCTPTTARGPPPSYHPSVVPNMQATLPIKDKDCLDLDAGYGTALAPQKLVDKTSQHLQKSPAITQTPTKGTSKRTTMKDYLPSANSGCAPEPENAPKTSKNVPPPYSALRGSSLQNSFTSKRGSTNESVHQLVQKTSVSLPLSLQESNQSKTEPQNGKAIISPPSSVVSPSAAEKASKTRIPMGFKAFLKSPPSHKNSPSVPGKHEKDHINSVSKETVTSNASTQCDSSQPVYSIDSPPNTSISEGKGEAQCRSQEEEVHTTVLADEGDSCDKGKRGSQLFSRSISVTTKPHLKPALGMNGAKARSQSFSTNYMEKPNINVLDGPGKIRTQIITNSGERGNSLSRQSSLEVPTESPIHSPRSRLSHYGGMTGSNSHNIFPERTPKSGSKGEGSQVITSPSQKEVRSLPITDRTGVNNARKPAKVASHPQFQPASSCVHSLENTIHETQGLAATLNEPDFSREVKTQTDPANKPLDMEAKKISPTACTIEEKVMMGIEENVQKCQEQEKVAATEAKQKTGPSLANWFGFRKSKLPALSGKKADSPKGKEEKKELKIGSVLGGKQMKSDKKKDKKKNDIQPKDSQEGQNLSEMNNKLSSIMDHCNNQMGQIASQIQCTTAFIGKDQFVKELLGRTSVKGSSVAASPPEISTPKKHSEMKGDVEICPDTALLIMSQKMNPRAENEEGRIIDTACQDHMIGSSCQMRTLDSGIGTFPLPDSVSRASGRHIPKSESSPGGVTTGSLELDQDPPSSHPEPSQPDVKVPSLPKTRLHAPTSMGHSLSDPTVICSSNSLDTQSRLPKLSTSDAFRTKRLSLGAPRNNISASTEDKEEEPDGRMKNKEHDMPGERALRVCTYSGSSSDTETELEDSPQRTLIHRTKKNDSVEQNEETLKRSSVETSLSIMDYYQHDMFSHLEDSRRISQYNLLHKESSLDGNEGDRLSKEIPLEKTPIGANQPGSLDFSLESLNKLNHSSSSSGSLYPDAALDGHRGSCDPGSKSGEDCCKADKPCPAGLSAKPGADQAGSLSDSLYDSFSSCTSQGSNDV